jgi:hypothetical protein
LPSEISYFRRFNSNVRRFWPSDVSPFTVVFFTFPQYAMRAANTTLRPVEDAEHAAAASGSSRPSAVADIEVTMVESHANLKVLSRRRPRQVLRMVAGLQGHRLAVLHLNVTSAGPMALYSLSLKVRYSC